jgi:hypothetical protein
MGHYRSGNPAQIFSPIFDRKWMKDRKVDWEWKSSIRGIAGYLEHR